MERKRRAGRVRRALKRSRIALTVIPIRRKGRRSNQTRGYRIRAKRASGQQRTKRINQSKNFTINLSSPVKRSVTKKIIYYHKNILCFLSR